MPYPSLALPISLQPAAVVLACALSLLTMSASAAGAATQGAGKAGATVPPKALKTVQLVYPEAADLDWSSGEVRLAFVVDERGQIGHLEILQGAHPAYTDAALDALLATPYQPGTRAGQPAALRVQREYQFKLRHVGVAAALAIKSSAKTSQRMEVAPAVQHAVWPAYPTALLRLGLTGSAKVRARVDREGTVASVELLAASHPDLGRAAVAMMQAWRFTALAPTSAGSASAAASAVAVAAPLREVEYEQRFSPAKPVETGVPASLPRLLERLAKGNAGIAGAGELDAPLSPMLQVPAATPPALRAEQGTGRATVDFYVDEGGRVLLPELVSASREDVGWAALTAVTSWRFAAPRRGGQPVFAR
ncbi:MAG TPA: TonB family protein, partial [Burkholderiaceae bacterium]|nr:TonB family protein [Burkholderiaceae bacterium]